MKPRWRSSLTSVNTYLLQAVNYVEYFANSCGKSTACFGTSGTLAPSGVGEVGAIVLAQAVYGKVASDLTTEEKANLLASAKLLAGVASGAISAGNGAETLANASVGMTVAENAVESNYLSDWQKAQQAKELKECNGNGYCEFKINAYWTAVDSGQDTSFVSGLAAGVPVAIVEGVSDVINMALSPIETLEAIKVMITQDDAFNKWAEATKQSYVERIEKLQSEYEKAGASGSFNAGLETGRLLTDIAGIVAGGAGVAKVGVSAVNKGIKSAAKNVKVESSVLDDKLKFVEKSKSAYKSDVDNLGVNNPKYNKELNENISNRVNGEVYNRDAINKLREGKLPGKALDNKTKLPVEGKIGVPRNMPSSKDPDAMAINFAEQFLGRKITPEEWEAGKNMFEGKDCINCFKVDLGNRQAIIYRSGVNENSSNRTTSGTASLDINILEVKGINADKMLKLKFPMSNEGE